MLLHAFYPKYLLLYTYLSSGAYIHFRGKLRHRFLRQLTDHSTLMAPINAFMYLFSKVPNTPYHDVNQYPELSILKENWKTIRSEAQNLVEQGYIGVSEGYTDVGFNSFFRKGWKRFYIKWYKDFHPSAKSLCPETVKLLNHIPNIKAAMFALLPKNSHLTKHRDPYAGSLRYHLGLITPNSEKCRIIVDNEQYHWRDGEAVMFDETYIHYAVNESDMDRIILFCDVERPLKNRFAIFVNRLFSRIIMTSSATKNFGNEKIGIFNKCFKYIYSIRLVGKKLKEFNKPLYYGVKYLLFAVIVYLVLR